MNKRVKKIVEPIMAFMGGLLVCFLALEILIRIFGWGYIAFQDYYNKLSIARNGYRIVCFGDSMTALQYPRFLEEELNRRSSKVKFTVIDKGRAGKNIKYVTSILEKALDEYKPHMVIAMGMVMDGGEEIIDDDVDGALPGLVDKPDNLLEHFKAYNLLRFITAYTERKARAGEVCSAQENNPIPKDQGLKAQSFPVTDFMREDLRYQERLNKAWDLVQNNDAAGGEKKIRLEIEKYPEKINAYIFLAALYKDRKKEKEYQEIVSRGLANDRDGNFNVWLGEQAAKDRKFAESEAFLLEALKKNSKEVRSYVQMGWNFFSQGRVPEAEAMFKKAIEVDPLCVAGYTALALFYTGQGKEELAEKYFHEADSLKLRISRPVAARYYYRKVRDALARRKIKFVCAQYPVQKLGFLKRLFEPGDDMIFVDNEKVFKDALKGSRYGDYFSDRWAGDFGHCTLEGNKLLAKNIADTLIKDYFDKEGMM